RKRADVCAAFEPYESLRELTVKPVAPASPMFGYRTRAKLIVSNAGEIGLYERGSHRVVDIPRCRVLHPALFEVVATLRGHACLSPGALTGIDVRLLHDPETLEPGVLVTLIGRHDSRPALDQLAQTLVREQPRVLGAAVRIQTSSANRLLEGELTPLVGKAMV